MATAQSVPPTVAQAPRMPFTLAFAMTKPLAALGVPVWLISSVAPTLRARLPTDRSRPVALF